MVTRFLLENKLIDQQLALRRAHAQQWQTHLRIERAARQGLEKQHRSQTQLLTGDAWSVSALIRQQLSEVRQLRDDKHQQRQQIRNRQAQEMAALNA